MKRPYETVVVFDGSLSSEVLQQEQKKVEDLIKQNGDFEKLDHWGNRRLAYEINKKRSGHYSLFQFQSDKNVAEQMDRAFKLNSNILRHLTIVREPDKKNNPKGKQSSANTITAKSNEEEK
ncbi:MAG: 30S ribosomal protein S6 [Chitinivibrionales bacterium]|nr:30S ribosomal protein S6 [Chitinivibrionales bacterium]